MIARRVCAGWLARACRGLAFPRDKPGKVGALSLPLGPGLASVPVRLIHLFLPFPETIVDRCGLWYGRIGVFYVRNVLRTLQRGLTGFGEF